MKLQNVFKFCRSGMHLHVTMVWVSGGGGGHGGMAEGGQKTITYTFSNHLFFVSVT